MPKTETPEHQTQLGSANRTAVLELIDTLHHSPVMLHPPDRVRFTRLSGMSGKQQALMIKLHPISPQKVALLDEQDTMLAETMANEALGSKPHQCDHCQHASYPCTGRTGWQPCAFCQIKSVPCTYQKQRPRIMPNPVVPAAISDVRGFVNQTAIANIISSSGISKTISSTPRPPIQPDDASNAVEDSRYNNTSSGHLESSAVEVTLGRPVSPGETEHDDFVVVTSAVYPPPPSVATPIPEADEEEDGFVLLTSHSPVSPIESDVSLVNTSCDDFEDIGLFAKPSETWNRDTASWLISNFGTGLNAYDTSINGFDNAIIGDFDSPLIYPNAYMLPQEHDSLTDAAGYAPAQYGYPPQMQSSHASSHALDFNICSDWSTVSREIEAAFALEVGCAA
ncbi:hypothetical protein NMY22_g899 [Coprinellus aureogranulatus]|nr:hypothetical protein NMY22_g899 [Coprinellus aureogranulatus]